MDGPLFAGSILSFVIAAVFHYYARFRIAAVFALLFWIGIARVMWQTMSPAWAIPIYLIFAVVPALLLLVAAIDSKRGFFNLPTFYFIPLSVLAGFVLVLSSILGVVF